MNSEFGKGEDFINVNENKYEIHFNGGITCRSMSTLIEKLVELEDKIMKKHKTAKRKLSEIEGDDYEGFKFTVNLPEIRLYITSNGGSVHQVFSAIDTIQEMRVPVHTICKGFVASAGTLLSLAGEKRYITENSYMLIHELRSGVWGKYTYMVENMENSKQVMEHIKSYYLKRTKISKEELDEQLKKDIIWDAQVCLEKGLVDEIIKSRGGKKDESESVASTLASASASASASS